MFAVMDVLGLTGAALGLVLRPQTVLTPLAGLQHFSILGGFLRSSQKMGVPGRKIYVPGKLPRRFSAFPGTCSWCPPTPPSPLACTGGWHPAPPRHCSLQGCALCPVTGQEGSLSINKKKNISESATVSVWRVWGEFILQKGRLQPLV